MYFSKKYRIFDKPKKKDVPEFWLRSMLISASAWVSFAHGSNDGQKGVGLVMLILISLIPTSFAINPEIPFSQMQENVSRISTEIQTLSADQSHTIPEKVQKNIENLQASITSENPQEIRLAILDFQESWKDFSQDASFFPQA